jgi:hypothetical protein
LGPAGYALTPPCPRLVSELYQAYGRDNPDVQLGASLEAARLLLGAGADPDDGRPYHALLTPFIETSQYRLGSHWEQA